MNFKKIIKKSTLLVALVALISSCKGNDKIKCENLNISEDTKFGSATIDITIENFNNLGFSLGDSVDLSFSNGFSLTDVPYFDGYYVKTGEAVLVAYPNSTNIIVTYNNLGIWESANLTSDTTVNIYLNTKEKYKATEDALGQSYSIIRSEYTSDEEFSNFRAISGGNLKDNLIYRGASPVDNSRNRAEITDSLLKKNNIQTVIDLADSESNINSYLENTSYTFPYTKGLIENNKMIYLSMSSSYSKDEYKQSVVKGFKFMLNNDGPYYIHCMEGKDRTGFVCLLVLALADGTYDELKDDYMKTYYNYYKINQTTKEKYDAIKELYFDSFITYLTGNNDINVAKTLNLKDAVISYLKNGNMTQEEIDNFINLITK